MYQRYQTQYGRVDKQDQDNERMVGSENPDQEGKVILMSWKNPLRSEGITKAFGEICLDMDGTGARFFRSVSIKMLRLFSPEPDTE